MLKLFDNSIQKTNKLLFECKIEETPYCSMFKMVNNDGHTHTLSLLIVTDSLTYTLLKIPITGHYKVNSVINTKLTLTYLAVSHIVLMVKNRLPIKPHFSRQVVIKTVWFFCLKTRLDKYYILLKWTQMLLYLYFIYKLMFGILRNTEC